ncbi:hypothetical protein H257_04753 [Aphanomyces astaci]|uniref:Uncharacterized protein n=1 Tax=Aphanomyces astaci TaxID=112090 RepID=W4GTC2_APHAT|nr:hypothetical protein H257_04753 [Aphanomyces astaci]ETV83005.1 hypothetical protein H257_04753 [Aphanomyces astaci]|eukprot:XP_009827676.1 hypothetical protein H257_04753 [Aphanomyces astaci]
MTQHEAMIPATCQRLSWCEAVHNLKNGSRLLDDSFAPDGMTIRFHSDDPGHQVVLLSPYAPVISEQLMVAEITNNCFERSMDKCDPATHIAA